ASLNPVTGEAANLAASVSSGPNAGATFAAITDQGNGTYTTSYTPTNVGSDAVAITLSGTAISGSPYTSVVSALPPTQLGFFVEPVNTTARTTMPAVQVEIQNALGNRVGTATNDVTLEIFTNPGSMIMHSSGLGFKIFGLVDHVTPAVLPDFLETSTNQIVGMAYDPTDDVIWAYDALEILVRINPVDATETIIGNSGSNLVGPLAFEGANGTGRLLTGSLGVASGGNTLFEVNRTTGVATLIGSVTHSGPEGQIHSYQGLANDPTTGTLWGLVRLLGLGDNVRSLVTIDVSTLTATFVAALPQPNVGGITFLPNGEMLAVTDDTSAPFPAWLWSVNKATGAMNQIIELGTAAAPNQAGEEIVRIPARLSGTLTVPAVGGLASFGDLQINGPASGYVLRATAGVLADALSNAFDITP
ncbi:MAG: hypothetical protein OER89_13310, partial [Gemmatimonadota bacterium]|nr:hypothetical protein [Gemmatimonadota bacterium]